jgi:cell wall-associated NlpC family hydrolase
VSETAPRSALLDRSVVEPLFVHPRRDLGAAELWERSLARSRARRAEGLGGRSLLSAALPDLDGPVRGTASSERDLTSEDIWELSGALARAKRRAVHKPVLHQARAASASLLVAAVAASVPATGGAQSKARKGASAQVDVKLLRFGSRGADVASVQRQLGIAADGIFGPKTRAAVRGFQRSHGLVVDGIVGPQTRAALARAASGGGGTKMFRAPWVAPVQRALGISADGVFGPQTRRAVLAFQARKGLVVDGIVGPQTLRALGLSQYIGSSGGSGGSSNTSSAAATAVRIARAQIGKPYAWGGNGPGSFDCSGLTTYSYRAAGVSLPRTSQAQFGVGSRVSRGAVRSGDLVFFATNGPGASHVGIAISNGSFVSATSHGVRIQPIGGSYWGSAYVGARRIR